MKVKKDFIYEYSDLNLFQTRAKILSGKYKDIIVEFGTSGVMHGKNFHPTFNFEYAIYESPSNFEITKDFENYLTDLLINIIDCRKKDEGEKYKLEEAASFEGVQSSMIKISKEFYPGYVKYHEPEVSNMESF